MGRGGSPPSRAGSRNYHPGKQLDRPIEVAQKIATVAAALGVRATMAFALETLAGEEAAFAGLLGEFAHLLQSDDIQEARRAAQEGRAPAFQGK